MNPRTDAELVINIQHGNILAFEELVGRYEKQLMSFVYRILKNEMDAQEVVQDAFFKVYATIDRIDLSRKFSTYLFEIAKNQAISRLRSRHTEMPLEEESVIETDEKIYESLTQKEQSEWVKIRVNKLPPNYRRVIELYYFADLAYEEISIKLKLPINTVRTHLLRAKVLLKDNLKNENS